MADSCFLFINKTIPNIKTFKILSSYVEFKKIRLTFNEIYHFMSLCFEILSLFIAKRNNSSSPKLKIIHIGGVKQLDQHNH